MAKEKIDLNVYSVMAAVMSSGGEVHKDELPFKAREFGIPAIDMGKYVLDGVLKEKAGYVSLGEKAQGYLSPQRLGRAWLEIEPRIRRGLLETGMEYPLALRESPVWQVAASPTGKVWVGEEKLYRLWTWGKSQQKIKLKYPEPLYENMEELFKIEKSRRDKLVYSAGQTCDICRMVKKRRARKLPSHKHLLTYDDVHRLGWDSVDKTIKQIDAIASEWKDVNRVADKAKEIAEDIGTIAPPRAKAKSAIERAIWILKPVNFSYSGQPAWWHDYSIYAVSTEFSKTEEYLVSAGPRLVPKLAALLWEHGITEIAAKDINLNENEIAQLQKEYAAVPKPSAYELRERVKSLEAEFTGMKKGREEAVKAGKLEELKNMRKELRALSRPDMRLERVSLRKEITRLERSFPSLVDVGRVGSDLKQAKKLLGIVSKNKLLEILETRKCLLGLDPERCRWEWKGDEEIDRFVHADRFDTRIYLSRLYPGVYMLPEKLSVTIPDDEFLELAETVDFLHPYENRTGRGRRPSEPEPLESIKSYEWAVEQRGVKFDFEEHDNLHPPYLLSYFLPRETMQEIRKVVGANLVADLFGG